MTKMDAAKCYGCSYLIYWFLFSKPN